MVRIFLILFIASSSFGQAYSLRVFRQTGTVSFTPESISGMALYWNYTDLANGSVASWVDRIQGVSMAQGTAGKRPTKDANGVLFTLAADGNLSCTTQTGTTYSNVTVWVVFKLSANGVLWKNILGDTANRALFVDGSSAGKMVIYPSSTTLFTASAGVWYDFAMNYTNSSSGTIRCYTNGVATATMAGFNDRWRLSTMGNDAGPGYGEPFDGYIKFVGIWTNGPL